jgi:two-component system sensor kinase FixL
MKIEQPRIPSICDPKGKASALAPAPHLDCGGWVHEGSPSHTSAGEYLEYLSQTAMEFVRLPPEADLYRHIATRLQALLGDAIVAVTSYDTETRELCQRAIAGSGKLLDAASALAGTKMRGFRQVLNAEAEQQMRVGRLMRIEEGLYEALLRTVPQKVTRIIEKTMGVRAVYGMGCLVDDECFGGVLILLRSAQDLPPAIVVETFISQSALAMQKLRAEETMRLNEERLRSVMEKATDAYMVLTTDGVIRDVNPGACRAMGYASAALIGRQLSDFTDTSEMVGKPIQWDRLKRGDVFSETRRMRRPDGSYVIFDSCITPLSDGRVLVIARDITDRRRLEKEVAETSRREREAIGRDLHDSLGQQLSGISYLCEALSKQLASRGAPEAKDAHRIAELFSHSVGQARKIAQGLCLVNLASGGVFSALSNLADHAKDIFGIDCRFVAYGEDIIPRDATASNLYLIAQEATTNAVRHGRASLIDIELQTCSSHGLLLIRDNGSGFDPSLCNGSGMGLRIMKYRAEMIDGLLEVTSGPSGTLVKCTFPLS